MLTARKSILGSTTTRFVGTIATHRTTKCELSVKSTIFFVRPSRNRDGGSWKIDPDMCRRGESDEVGKLGGGLRELLFPSISGAINIDRLQAWWNLEHWIELNLCFGFFIVILPTSQDESEFLHKLLITDLQIGEKIWIELNKLFKCYVRIFSVNYPNRDR